MTEIRSIGDNLAVQPVAPTLYADLIGAPYVAGGRGPSGYDCLGLTLELQRRLGRSLPAYLSDFDELHRQVAAGGALNDAQRLYHAEAGCVALLKSPSPTGRHLGVMLDAYRMIHAEEGVGSVVITPLLRSAWSRKLLGFYRVESRA